MTSRALSLFTVALLSLAPRAASAQDEPVDIEVGSERIGGPGTRQQQARDAAWNAAVEEEEAPMTEETLPPPGHKKRIPALHKLARQYFGGRMWKESCEKYDQIVAEGQEAALEAAPSGKSNAARSFLECAQIAQQMGDGDGVERWLKKSEKLAPPDHRHAAIRRKVMREEYRKILANGDTTGAIAAFKRYQAQQPDEDERIWLGEELAKLSWNAYNTGDKVTMKELIHQTEEIAPMNTELRQLKSKLDGEASVLRNVLIFGAAAVALVLLGTQWSRWRSRARLKGVEHNPFEDSLDDGV